MLTDADADAFLADWPGILGAAGSGPRRPAGAGVTRHFLRDDDLTPAEQAEVLALAAELKRAPYAHQPLGGPRTVAMIFDKQTLRTQASFSAGIAELGGYPMTVDGRLAGIGERESVEDVARVLGRQASIIVWRTGPQSRIDAMAAHAGVPVVNALTDDFHPCQLLADLLTIREHKGGLEGLTVAFVGDGACNMGNSWLLAGATAGLHVVVSSPAGYEPTAFMVATAADIAADDRRLGPARARPRRRGGRCRRRRHRHVGVDGHRGPGRRAARRADAVRRHVASCSPAPRTTRS